VLLGIVDIADLLLNDGAMMLKDFATDSYVSLTPDDSLKEASYIFHRYGFRAIPVIDHDKRMLGVILYKDIMKLKHKFIE
jgi:magnesium transporter